VRAKQAIATTASIVCSVLIATAAPAAAAGHGHAIGPDLVKDGYSTDPSYEEHFWYREDTNLGTATLSKAYGAPSGYGDGALVLTTSDNDAAKARLMGNHVAYSTPLADVNKLAYWTYQSSATARATDDASFIVRIDVDGDFTTTDDVTALVYEPQLNDTEGPNPQQPIAPDVWQYWDATNGAWSVTNKIVCGTFEVDIGGGPNGTTSPADVATHCPNAVGIAFGAGIGPGAPNAVVATDGFLYGTTSGDFTWNFGPK
jgi:hypothetical protein